MFIIAGLGNPGAQYAGTRHNMGFDVIDRLVDQYRVPQDGVKFHALTGRTRIGSGTVLLMKPLTYMNLGSGRREAPAGRTDYGISSNSWGRMPLSA